MFVLVAGASSTARADVVDEPPSCPDGATPNGCHSGPYCNPLDCSLDETCPGGKVCQMVEKCAQQFECGGGFTTGGGGNLVDDILGECGEGGTCAKGTCKQFKLCVSESVTTSDTAASGGSSDTAASSGSSTDPGTASASDGEPTKKPLGCDGCRAGEDPSPALLLLALLGLSLRRRRAA